MTKDTDMIKCLKEFHKAFRCETNERPRIPDDKTALLRVRLITEEVAETIKAMSTGNMVEILDGLVDTVYVIVGAAISYGLGDVFMEAFAEVHKNNMSKLGPDGKPIIDSGGKIIKPERYKPVDLKPLLEKAEKSDSPKQKGHKACKSCASYRNSCWPLSDLDIVCKSYRRIDELSPPKPRRCCSTCGLRNETGGCRNHVKTSSDGCCTHHRFPKI